MNLNGTVLFEGFSSPDAEKTEVLDLYADNLRWACARIIFAKLSPTALVLAVLRDYVFTGLQFLLHFSPTYIALHATCLRGEGPGAAPSGTSRVPPEAWPWRLRALRRFTQARPQAW